MSGSDTAKLDVETILRFKRAFRDGSAAYKELAMNMASCGLGQAAIYHLFDSYGHSIREGDQFEKATIWCSIECIVGWHRKENCWFDHFLTKEEIDEYRNKIAHPIHPRCFYGEWP